MNHVGEPVGPLAIAQQLAEMGLQVLPARHRDKAPIVKWRNYQTNRTNRMLPIWFGSNTPRNYWVMTGRISGVVVIDCDSEAGEKWWRQTLGDDVMESAAIVATRKGHHYWFKIPPFWDPTQPVASWSIHKDDLSFDVRADETGVIVPPSVHPSGHIYTWLSAFEDAAYAPPELLDGSLRARAGTDLGGSGEGLREGTGGQMRSMLTNLLSRPPAEGGRNEWLARVAGHYAKTYHNHEDLFLTHCQQANERLDPPLSEEEFHKTIDSIWRGEHERNPQRAVDAECGWLVSGGHRIMTQVVVRVKEGSERTFDLDEYADFDLQARGVMVAPDKSRTYWVQIIRRLRGTQDTETIDTVLPAYLLGDDRAFRKWLAKYGCTVNPPESMWPKTGTMGIRFQRYLEAQQPVAVQVTATLGWDDDVLDGRGGFVTHENVITASQILTCEDAGTRPNPLLLTGGIAPHRYGFIDSLGEAQRVLREVMTFHEPQTTAVFGAWWAACLLKPQIERHSSLFPFMAVEAPSESGKTNGFFDLMTQLNGNTSGETQPTRAALRDMAAAHRNGIVWVDDLDDPAYLMELLRAATSGGTLTKMGEDRESVKATRIVSPIVISGEALGLGTQKALLDRAVILKVNSPTGRRSTHDPSRPQWDDVLALRAQFPNGLADVAGWLVQHALTAQDETLTAVRECRSGKSGREADKVAILRAGARLLDYLMAEDADGQAEAWQGHGWVAHEVERWVEAQSATGIGTNENSLTLQILPWALRTFQYPSRAEAGENASILDTPVFVKNFDGTLARITQSILGEDPATRNGLEIWFNTSLLAQAYEREYRGRIERRTQTEAAIRDQANALDCASKRFKIVGGNGRTAYYRSITGDLAEKILDRARGR